MAVSYGQLVRFVCVALALATASTAARAAERLPGPIPAVLLRVIDGDSLEVEARVWLGQHVRIDVRIAGFDAPELKGACLREEILARQAAEQLVRLIAAQPVPGALRLYDVRNGKFAGRVLARVETADGRDLGQLLHAGGLARVYDGGRRGSWCDLAEADRGATGEPQ